ncbi:MAG: ATP-binding protein [Algoriphagus sp.]|uniref:hybrid sensor histidine kinase/response regulator n=1 Tax=Algoriphagus sp. TaxID=1872435 RepID=UPI00261065CE|nr:hybrid sensor histidine kinase/response regulator [Algoriphagus sp.]MDG1278658.1 ATP-binding protein [Algoriphagus sp.]
MSKEQIRILYVDDDPDDFFLIESFLKKIDDPVYTVEHAFSYEEAQSRILERFDIFLVDYRLGKTTGLELIKEIRLRQTHAAVILLTGMAVGNLDREALQLGASDYLVKGEFDAATLDRTLRFAYRDSQIKENLDLVGEKFRSIFERASDPFLLIDGESLILEVNPSSIAKFEFEEKILTQSKLPFFTELIEEQFLKNQLIEKLRNKFEIIDFEATLINKSGNTFRGLVNIAKQNANTFQVLIKDLSAIKAKEEEEHNLKKFSSTGRIARLLAHEVKNPLTTIVLSADQLQMELPEEVLKESGDLIEVIQRNCQRINQLVTQLLDSTRFSELDISSQSINSLLDEALDTVKDRIEMKKIKIIKNYDPDICKIEVDPEKVKIALINLIVNAVEAIDRNEGEMKLSTAVKSKFCRVEIEDNGTGISKENLERLFEPFFTSKSTGTGLGLTNTQNIIFSHGGSIRVKSEVGRGTTFIINFKMSQTPEEPR